MSKNNKLIMAADVGANETSLGLFSPDPAYPPILEETYRTRDFKDAGQMLGKFLSDNGAPGLYRACLAVPGSISDNQSTTTNLPWFVDGKRMATDLGIPEIRLINDLEATATAIPELVEADLFTINPGRRDNHGNIAVISPGTGLGEGFLTNGDGTYTAHPSEGGHSDFAPINRQEIELLQYLQEILGHVSYEQVCSGAGLMNLYSFVKRGYADDESSALRERLNAASDPSRVIIEAAIDESRACPLCLETMSLFVAILGSEAGNLALKTMATGGLYIGGGITPKIRNILDSSLFLKRFFNKGRVSQILSDIPVHVIMNRKTTLNGAALLARQAL